MVEAVRLHVASYGPSSRHDVAWWSGLGLRQVDTLLDRLDLTWRDGPDGRAYADLPGPPAAREVPGVRLLPEFDALLCGYDPKARGRFVSDADNEVLWHRANGLMLAPVLVDGRIRGHWRLEGSGRSRTLAVSSYAGSRRLRRAEVDEAADALATALDVTISAVTTTRLLSQRSGADEVRRRHTVRDQAVGGPAAPLVHRPRGGVAVDAVARRRSVDAAVGAGVEAEPLRVRAAGCPTRRRTGRRTAVRRRGRGPAARRARAAMGDPIEPV